MFIISFFLAGSGCRAGSCFFMEALLVNAPEIERFYMSHAWRKCRKTFLESRRGLCEICLSKGLIEPATEAHHKIRLTPENIDDPNISLNHDNLMALCEACHHEQHQTKRWRCDAMGRVTL
jgi:hypothetical protein